MAKNRIFFERKVLLTNSKGHHKIHVRESVVIHKCMLLRTLVAGRYLTLPNVPYPGNFSTVTWGLCACIGVRGFLFVMS